MIYANDKLSRDRFCKSIVDVIKNNINKPEGLTIALNGQFGRGKTTVLNFIKQEFEEMQQEKYLVLEYDCWKNNFFEDPIIPMLYSLTNNLSNLKNTLTKNKLKKKGLEIIKFIGKVGLSFAENKLGAELPEKHESINIFNDIKNYEKAINELRQIIKEIIKQEGNIVFLIDEIDRCLPTYAIKVLEKINHIFAIKGFCTVLAVDKEQLEKTIETVFGENTNVSGYLSRFIDYEFGLPANSGIAVLEEKIGRDKALIIHKVLRAFNLETRENLRICDNLTLLKSYIGEGYEYLLTIILMCLKLKTPKLFKELLVINITDYFSDKKIYKVEETLFFKLDELLQKIKFYNIDFFWDMDSFRSYALSSLINIENLSAEDVKRYFNNITLDSRIYKHSNHKRFKKILELLTEFNI